MKIHILPVDPQFQPARQNFVSPPHNEQWGVEQDWLSWLHSTEYVTDDPRRADWDYLPVFWNRYYINNQWGGAGLIELQAEILSLVSRNRPTFTICEYDLASLQPFWDLCSMTVFTASRRSPDGSKGRGEGTGIDIPLLCTPHQADAPHATRRWLTSFAGNLNTHSPRPEMAEALRGRGDCHVEHADKGTSYFVDLMLDSYLALCPRGHGGASFRFYEAMQLGIAPLLIGDLDTRPFKRWLDWDSVSLYRPGVAGLSEYLDTLDRDELVAMGQRAREMYANDVQYGQWCRYVIKELEYANH